MNMVKIASIATPLCHTNCSGEKSRNKHLTRAYAPALMTTPESMALIGLGAAACASGSHVWNGAMEAVTPNPTTIRMRAK